MITVCKHTTPLLTNRRSDATRTFTLRRAFEAEMNKRFRRLRGLVRRAIIEQDVFGMNDMQLNSTIGINVRRRQFDFPRTQDKVAAFMEWFAVQRRQGILGMAEGQQLGEALETAWTSRYIEDSYKRGVQRARHEMIKAGYPVASLEDTGGIVASMNSPFHVDRVGALYSRAFTKLKGITNAMDDHISQVLAQGIADGDHPRILARKLNATISGARAGELGVTDSIGRFIPAERRARMLARTEIIRAHHQATIQEYQNWRVEGVRVRAEWSTSGVNVCPDCQDLEGQVFSLEEMRGMIPYHPNCACLALPVEVTDEK